MQAKSPQDNQELALVALSKAEVANRFSAGDSSLLYYHSLSHTEDVVHAAREIAAQLELSPSAFEAILIAAWWHDVGMIDSKGDAKDHEKASAEACAVFLRAHKVDEKHIALIQSIILATDIAVEPVDLLQKVIRDADLSGLGSKDFKDRIKLLRLEWQATGRLTNYNKTKWLEENLDFISSHRFYTSAAENLYGDQKKKNCIALSKQLKKRKKKEAKKNKKKKSSKSAIQSEKSAQMMLKTTLRNNIDLTSIADGKANIMLSINAVILSLGMPLLAAYVPEFNYLAIPGAFLLITSVLSIMYATLATRPVRTSGETNLDEITSGKTNLFFFGNYYKMPIDEYKRGLKTILANQDVLDSSVMNDLYFLGVALGQKFNRLRTCYAIFSIGMILTAVAFVVTFYWTDQMTQSVEIPANILMPAIDSVKF